MMLLLCFSLVSCSEETDKIEETDSAESLTEQIGFDMSIPATAKNAEFCIINSTIAEIRFSFNSIKYVYRGSKLYSNKQLHGMSVNGANPDYTIDIGDRATVSIYYPSGGGTVVTWYIEGTYYSLTSVKGVNSDVVTELCDLIIK